MKLAVNLVLYSLLIFLFFVGQVVQIYFKYNRKIHIVFFFTNLTLHFVITIDNTINTAIKFFFLCINYFYLILLCI